MSQIKAGAYKVNITPPLGMCIAGTFSIVKATEIVDDLFIHALVLDDGVTETAILSADVCFLSTEFVHERILPRIESSCNISTDHIIIAATHTHSGPLLHSTLPEVFGTVSEEYLERFVGAAVTAVLMAIKQKVPVHVGAGSALNKNHVFNRRLKKPDGSIVMNFVEQDFLADCVPAGAVDPEVIVMRFDDENYNPIALIVNYANHNNTFCGVDVFSSTISGYMKSILEKVYGSKMVTIFLLGACGNTNWVDHRKTDVWTDREIHKKIGIGLAGSVLQIMPMIEYCEVDKIKIAHEILEISDRAYSDYDTFEDDTFGRGALRNEFYVGYKSDRSKYEKEPLAQNLVHITAIAIGGKMAISSNPAELFTEFGMKIKQNSPFKYSIVSELTNGACGYVPTTQAFAEGGYEVRKMKESSHLSKKAGEIIVNTSIQLLGNCFENC